MYEPVVVWRSGFDRLLMQDMGAGLVALGFAAESERWNPFSPSLATLTHTQLTRLTAAWLGISVEQARKMREAVSA